MEIEVDENSGHDELISEYHSGDIEGATILPRGSDPLSNDHVLYETDSATIQKLLEQSGVEYTPLDIESDSSTVIERSDALVLPAIYFGYRIVRDNWDHIESGLSYISDYYHRRAVREIDLEVVQENEDSSTNTFKFTGHPDDLEKLPDHMKEVIEGDDE